MRRQLFQDLGKRFYDWHKIGKVKFVYGTEGKGLNEEIEHISELIEYVKKKKECLLPSLPAEFVVEQNTGE